MNIKLDPVESREKAMQRVERKQKEIATSKWTSLANGDFGQSHVNEGKRMLARQEQELKQLIDIANHRPVEPTVYVRAYNAYAEKETLKANGFRWDGGDKSWGRNVKVADLDALMAKIGASVPSTEMMLAGVR